MPNITAIIVAFNSGGIISQALESLKHAPEIAQVIVVDNASSDDTAAIVARDFPEALLIKNTKNDGYGRANNIALERVTTEYALLVNPDAVMKDGAIAALLNAAKTYPDAAILAPRLCDENGHWHHSYKRSVFEREASHDEYVAPESDLCADFLSGAVWLLCMKHMQEVGYFDPELFLYYEDDDLCLRVREQRLGLVLVHDAVAVHLMGASSGKPNAKSEYFKQKHTSWSRLYIEEKYRGPVAARKLALKHRLYYAGKALLYMVSGNSYKLSRYRGRLKGITEFSEIDRPRRQA